ncbi:hypothetical protein ACX40Y_07225, partial [Sphingomonas sp. RS6]
DDLATQLTAKAAVKIVKRGWIFILAAVPTALLAFFLWPYRSETIESNISKNNTGCSISVTSNGGWKNEMYLPGIWASRVAYPLDVRVFVDECRNLPEGRPYSVDLVSTASGTIIARGMYCAENSRSEDYPCQLELPPLASLTDQNRYVVRVRTARRHTVVTARIQLYLKREWRSVGIDAMLSV